MQAVAEECCTGLKGLNDWHSTSGEHVQARTATRTVVIHQFSHLALVHNRARVTTTDDDETFRFTALVQNLNGPKGKLILLKQTSRTVPQDTPGIDDVRVNLHAREQADVVQWTRRGESSDSQIHALAIDFRGDIDRKQQPLTMFGQQGIGHFPCRIERVSEFLS